MFLNGSKCKPNVNRLVLDFVVLIVYNKFRQRGVPWNTANE